MDGCVTALVRIRKPGPNPSRHSRHLDACRRQIDVLPEPPDHREIVRTPLRGQVVRREPERHPGVHAQGKVERLGHHAGDFPKDAVEVDRSADDGGIAAEATAPEAVAEDHDVGRAGTLVRSRERASVQGPDAEHVEESAGHGRTGNLLGGTDAREGVPAVVDRGDRVEGRRLALPVGEIRRGDAVQRGPGPRRLLTEARHDDEPVGVRIREGTPEHRAGGAVNRRVRADAERERENRRRGDRGAAGERADRVANILRERVNRDALPAEPQRMAHESTHSSRQPGQTSRRRARALGAQCVGELGGPFAPPGIAVGCRHDPRNRANQTHDRGGFRVHEVAYRPARAGRGARTGFNAWRRSSASFSVRMPSGVGR